MNGRRGFLARALGVPVAATTAIRDGDLSKPALFGLTMSQYISGDQLLRIKEALRPYEEQFNCKFMVFQPDTTITKLVG
jgi:hypothetical protein